MTTETTIRPIKYLIEIRKQYIVKEKTQKGGLSYTVGCFEKKIKYIVFTFIYLLTKFEIQ